MRPKALFIYYWMPVGGWMGLIFYFSSLPSSSLPQTVPDYVAHFFEYAILSWLFHRALRNYFSSEKILFPMAISFTLLYAISDEIHQFWVPSRSPALADLGADSLGALFALIFLILVRKF